MTNIDPIQLQNDLAQFYGTQEWHRWSPLFRNMVLTDGAQYLADKAQCYWLMDAIASHQTNKKVWNEYSQFWTLRNVGGRHFVLTCDDGNGNILTTQDIPDSDFPLSEIKLYAMLGGPQNTRVILLPGEY